MIAEFYLVGASFRYYEGITAIDLEDRIKDLAIDCDYIRKNKDKQLRYSSIFDEFIYPDISVLDFLYTPNSTKQIFDRDSINALQNIIEKAEETTFSNTEIIDFLDNHDENCAYGLLCLHHIAEIDEIAINQSYLVYNRQNWLAFKRHFLGLYPRDTAYFYSEASKYFPELYLHERNIEEMKPIYDNFVKRIIYHLGCLNDSFHKYKTEPYERIQTLKAFSSLLDDEATNQGGNRNKAVMTFDFPIKDDKVFESICCEPHMKLCHSDNYRGDGKYYQHRIYFHEGKPNIQNGKILVGHIGEHL